MFANIWGEAGVDKLVSILTTELRTQMQLLGVKSLAEVDASHVSCHGSFSPLELVAECHVVLD
jgi:isopentenyl diphosphate isomerase/L-lactate dehydrogenase-like FMN-dependent dehydrogenase